MKLLLPVSHFKAKMHKLILAGVPSQPTGELTVPNCPRLRSWIKGVLLLREGRGKKVKGGKKERKEEGRGKGVDGKKQRKVKLPYLA